MIEGQILRSGNRLRVTLALIHAPSDRRIWTAVYEKEISDVFALYSDVAQAVAREIKLPYGRSDRGKNQVVNPDAYEVYLSGIYFLDRWHRGGCVEAERYLLKSIELDRGFAPPYADLAWRHAFPARLGRPLPRLNSRPALTLRRPWSWMLRWPTATSLRRLSAIALTSTGIALK